MNRAMKVSKSKLLGALGVAALVAGIAMSAVATPLAQTGRSTRFEVFGGSGLGASVSDVDAAVVTRLKLTSSTGALVSQVNSTGPAAKAGLKVDDVILTFDGETVRSARQLTRLVEETPDGKEVAITVLRDGAKVNLKLTPDASADPLSSFFSSTGPMREFQFFNSPNWVTPQPFFSDSLNPLDRTRGRLGVDVQELTGQLGDYFGTKEGVLITSVADGTPAKSAGLKAGDVITKFNGRTVLNPEDLRRRVTGASGDVTIAFMRDRKELAVTIKLDGGTPREIIK